MTNRLVDPLLLGRPLALEWPEGNERKPVPARRKRPASSVLALLVMLVAALVMVPVAIADDDGDDNGGGGGGGGAPATLADACTAAALPPPANLVVNGDFELPPIPPPFATYGVGTGPTGWLVTEGTVDQVHRAYWLPACGDRSMDLTGTPGQGTLVQNVAGTDAGQEYRLLFAYGANPDPLCTSAEPTTVTADVRWGGATVTTLSRPRVPDTTPLDGRDPNWQLFETTVVGQAGSTLLEFDSNSSVNPPGTLCGVTIDAVSLTQITDGGDDDNGDDDDNGGDDDD